MHVDLLPFTHAATQHSLWAHTAKFTFADSGSPTVISDSDDNDLSALYVLMPMRV